MRTHFGTSTGERSRDILRTTALVVPTRVFLFENENNKFKQGCTGCLCFCITRVGGDELKMLMPGSCGDQTLLSSCMNETDAAVAFV